jgi:cytochrome P450
LTSPAFSAVRTADIVKEVARRAGRDYRSLTRFLDAALFFKTGTEHLRDRRTLAAVMNRISLTDLEPTVREMARALAAPLASGGDIDAVAALADPLPQKVMALILDIPGEDVPVLGKILAELTLVFDPCSLSVYDRVSACAVEALDLLANRIEKAASHSPSSPLAMILREAAGDGHREKLENAAATALFMYRVGAETTIGLLGALIRAIIDRPEVRSGLQEKICVDRFVGELLRTESNVQRVARVARHDCTVADVQIKAGQRLLLLVGAANRDPAIFCAPDEIETTQKRSAHLAFGAGDHYCLGAALAQMEARVVLETLLDMRPLERAGDELWYPGRTVRRLISLPVRLRQ